MTEQPKPGDVDRRRFLKRAATIGWSTPVILTLLAQSAAASHAVCIHEEAQCGTDNGAGGCTNLLGACCSGLTCLVEVGTGLCLCVTP